MNYQDFAKYIDLDAMYSALDWEPLESVGDEDRGYCLDFYGLHKHGDRTGKLSFNREKMAYNCWVCGGGSILSFAMEARNCSSEEATEWLYQFARPQELSTEKFAEEIEALIEQGRPTVENPLPHFNIHAIIKWARNDSIWFEERGIYPDVKDHFRLGYNPQATRTSKLGVTYTGPSVILPHFWQGNLVGWQSRWLDSQRPAWIPKYTNTAEFPKRKTLWGLDFAQEIADVPIIVESVPTALFLISEGFPAVATFGAKITPEQIERLRIFQRGVLLAADNDDPGLLWRSILTEGLENFIPVQWVPLMSEEGEDLGDLAPDGQTLEDMLNAAVPPSEG